MQWAKKSSLTEVRRAQIVTLHGEGFTERDIAAKLSYSTSSVLRVIIKFNVDGPFQTGNGLVVHGRLR